MAFALAINLLKAKLRSEMLDVKYPKDSNYH